MRGGRWLLGLGICVVLAIAGTIGWRRDARTPAAQLAAFVGEGRWTPGRSTLDLPYRPYGPPASIEDFGAPLAALFEPETRRAPDQPLAVAHFLIWRGEPGDD